MKRIRRRPASPPRQLQLVLASGSPRRRDILQRLGLDFTVRPPEIDETQRTEESAAAYVMRLAEEKARVLAHPGELVLAADTTVEVDGEVLGKPTDADDARRMLEKLAGRWHRVLTGIALYDPEHTVELAAVEKTRVRMSRLKPAEIDWYVASGEPLDKAGAYAIQGFGSLFVREIAGNYSNVVGLPVPLLYRLLRWLGWSGLGPIKGLGSVAELDGITQRGQ